MGHGRLGRPPAVIVSVELHQKRGTHPCPNDPYAQLRCRHIGGENRIWRLQRDTSGEE